MLASSTFREGAPDFAGDVPRDYCAAPCVSQSPNIPSLDIP